MRSIFISGEPALWSAGASPQSAALEERWKARIRNALGDSLPTPKSVLMQFSVESWTRRGHHFDLDNLVTPVFAAIYGKKELNRPDARNVLISWRATIGQSPTPSLLLDFLDVGLWNPEQTCDCHVVIDATWPGPLPTDSGPGDCGFPAWVQQNIGAHVPLDNHRFGVQLVFGSTTGDISRPEQKPIKPVIDCLYPIFGGKPRAGHDWKKCILQVERRNNLQGSCHIRCWLLNKFDSTTAS